jgi:hypothetical protein
MRLAAFIRVLWVLRGFVSAYSQNEVAETLQRFLGPGASAACDGADIRHRPGAEVQRPLWCPARENELAALGRVQTIGAVWCSGNMAGKSSRFAVRFALSCWSSDVLGKTNLDHSLLFSACSQDSLRPTAFLIRSY